jgi:hypothetical protein
LAVLVCIHTTGDMHPVICASQPAAMGKRKNKVPHVGALSDAQKAARRAGDRVRKQKQRSGLKACGLKETMSEATKAKHKLRDRTQRRWINGGVVWLPVQQGPPTAEQLARDATDSRLMLRRRQHKLPTTNACTCQGSRPLQSPGLCWPGSTAEPPPVLHHRLTYTCVRICEHA